MWRGIWSFGGMLLVLSSNVCAQHTRVLHPLHTTPLLSGNFGELRATHLHAGVDFKTGGREGMPVICVKDGRVARINISPTGYGNALYIEHEGSITSVYGHLSRFVPKIEKVARDIQYAKESFAIDENVLARDLFFKAGDTIAYSGNTGGSMGPHLHFEVRNTESEHALNPLCFLTIKDETTPTVRGVYVYPISKEGMRGTPKRVEVKKAPGNLYQAGKVGVPAGRVGMGVQADDFMKDSWNKLGIYEIVVSADGEKVFHLKMDEITFGQGALVNEIKDYDQYRENRLVYTAFGNYQDQLVSVTNTRKGYIRVEKDSTVEVSLALRDIHGHCSNVRLQLVGKLAAPEVLIPVGASLFDHEQSHDVRKGAYSLFLGEGALPYPVICKPELSRRVIDSTRTIDVFSLVKNACPLLKAGRLVVRGKFSDKSVLCLVTKGTRLSPLSTKWRPEGLEASVRVLGEYAVREDEVPPVIAYMGVSTGRKIRFRILDDFSGISTYRVEVNGKWCLFNYDAKNRMLEGSLNEPVFVKGKNKVVLTVGDAVKNIATFETEIIKK